MATLKPRGKSWQLSWVENGQQQRKTLGPIEAIPKKQALAILHAKQFELSQAAKFLPELQRSTAPTLSEWAKEYLLWHEMEFPDSHYRVRQIVEDHLAPEFGGQFLDRLDPSDVEEYKRKRARGKGKVKSATITKELRTLKALINRAVALRIIRDNPIAIVVAPQNRDSKPHRFYTAEELQAIYAATQAEVNGGVANKEHAAWWKLYANTGMRKAEGIHLRRRDIGSDGLRIVSTEAERTKSMRWRDIPLSDGARDALEMMPKHEGGYVLPRIHPGSLSRAFAHDARRAGLDGSLHTLRHSYISHLVLQGVPLRTVQVYAGHSSVTVTEQYAYLSPGRASAAAIGLRL